MARKFLQGLPSLSKDFPNFSKLFPSFFQGFPSFFFGGSEGNQGLAVERGRIRSFLSLPPRRDFSRSAARANSPFAGLLNSLPIVDSADWGFQKGNVGCGGRSGDG
ncbi:MAG: hypothetical protein ACLPSW_28620 [Roseiarcus sp.]